MHGRLRARPGAVVARRRAGRLQRPAPRPGLAAVRGDHGGRDPARPGDRGRGRQPDDQRPRGVHARQRVHPRRVGGPRVLRRGRVLRPRHRRRRRDRPADGDLDRRRRARARPVEDGHPPVRSAVPLARRTRSPGRSRSTRPTTTSTTRTRSAWPDGRCGRRPTYERLAGARRVVRREVGLGAAELVRGERRGRATRHSARAAGRASTGARRSGRRRWRPAEAAGLFDETSFAKIEVGGPGALRLPPAAVRQRRRPAGRRVTYTQMLNRRGGIECDFTVTRLGAGALPDRDRDGVRQPRPRLDPEPRPPDDGSVSVRDVTVGAGVLRAVGPARARHPGAAHDGRPVGRRRSRT